MTSSGNDNVFRPRKELQSLTRNINLNDMHYCNLQAIVEADSGRGAVEQYIKDRPWQVFRKRHERINDFKNNESPEKADEVLEVEDVEEGDGTVTTDSTGTEQEGIMGKDGFDSPELQITEQDLGSRRRGLMRSNPNIIDSIEMAKFKITCTNQPEEYVWVYRMGNHWVICN